ncbi:MAG: response regulator transcription factor [Dehalococcoidales bacterium]|nr:response regulator transcription factor [Dehalococcoidales bacterium]
MSTGKATILVVDDEKNIVHLAKLYLSNEGYNVETAAHGVEALEKARLVKPNLVVLDLMMPEMDGWEVCRRLRKDGDVPIIILTARSDDVDKIVGLELGADDYVTKPFNPRELVARVKAVLRRYGAGARREDVITIANLRIDLERREVLVADASLDLRAKEFDLLATLAANPGVVFSREKLLESIWGYDYFGDTRTIDVHITWLREKLAKADAAIKTVWGIGYKLVPSSDKEGEAKPD